MNFVFASFAVQSSFKRRDCFTAFAMTNLRLFFDEFMESFAVQSSFKQRDCFTAFAMTKDLPSLKTRYVKLSCIQYDFGLRNHTRIPRNLPRTQFRRQVT